MLLQPYPLVLVSDYSVCYLAGEFIESLQQRQRDLNITDSDILCIKLAALCHDLGHGPFSHLFDKLFIPKLNPPRKWKVLLLDNTITLE